MDTLHNILFICTSSQPGLWLDELATPYYVFKGAGYKLDICSINTTIQIDPASLDNNMTKESAAFMNDNEAQSKFLNPYNIDNMYNSDKLSSYGCVYLCGGHGCIRDFGHNEKLTSILEFIYNKNKGCIGSICHGQLALLDVKEASDEEEDSLGILSKLPMTVESSLDERGALIVKAAPWMPKACVDARLATGQNPQSSVETSDRVLDILRSLGNKFSPPENANKPWGAK